MGTFVSNGCLPACLIASMSLSPLLHYLTNLAEIHNYVEVVTTGTTSPLLSSNAKNTIFWFYISKDELHARLCVRTALLMQILFFWDKTRCRVTHNYQLSGMACSLFLQDDKTEVEIRGGTQKFPELLNNYLKYLHKFETLVPFEVLPLRLDAAIPAPLPMQETLSKIFNGNAVKGR